MEISLNMYQSLGLAAIFYYVGVFLKKKISPLTRYCVPAPAVGGIVFAFAALLLYVSGVATITLDTTFQNLLMWCFFASAGFASKPRMLTKVGKKFVLVLIVSIGLCFIQNIVGAGVMAAFGRDPLIGMCVGSIPLVGGHATSASFADSLEAAGCSGALTFSLAAATFGVISGGILGGPTAKRLITKYRLAKETEGGGEMQSFEEADEARTIDGGRFMKAMVLLVICCAPGQLLSGFLTDMGLIFPVPVSALMVGCAVGMVFDGAHIELPQIEMETLGNCFLGLFLTLSMMSVQLWQLADLAVPFIAALLLEAAVTVLVSYFLVFKAAGRDYEAAVMASGVIGFGLGATPNALANMNTLRSRYGPAPLAFIIIPLLGTMFVDIFNSLIVTGFINFLS